MISNMSVTKRTVAPSFDLFNALPDWVWLRELDGAIIEVNEAALRRTGFKRAEMVGKPISDFYYNEQDRPRSGPWTKQLLKERVGFLVLTLRDKAGKPV